MVRKIVGILGSTSQAKDVSAPARHFLNRAYTNAIEQAGGIPILLPITAEMDTIERYLGLIDGLMLSGGVDVAPERYGQKPHPRLGEVDPDRDATEIPLIQAALRQDMPTFGICRGIQSLNVAMGGTLYQDLPSERPSTIHHQQADQQIPRHQAVHVVHIQPESRLASVVCSVEMNTNSLHHQALKDVAEELTVTAHAPDGVIEGVESLTHRYLVGVQFHPEETAPRDEKSRRLFEAFVAAL